MSDDTATAAEPLRLQLRRTPGWRMPANSVSCARPSLLGNPWPASRFGQAQAVAMHEIWLREPNAQALGYAGALAGLLDALRDAVLEEIPKLRGKNLACWCPLPAPGQRDCCHAATLLRLANAEPSPTDQENRRA